MKVPSHYTTASQDARDAFEATEAAGAIEGEKLRALVDEFAVWHRETDLPDLDRQFARFTYRLAKLYRTGENGVVMPDLADHFERIAAEWGHFQAQFQQVQQSQDPRAIESAFATGLEELNNSEAELEPAQLIPALKELILRLSDIDLRRGFLLIGRLLEACAEWKALSAMAQDVQELGKDLVKRMGAGVYVLKQITPATDRSTKDALARYQVRVVAPTPLALVPALEPLQRALDAEFPWFQRVTFWVVQSLASRALSSGSFGLPPFLLAGGPGIGKSAYVQRLGELSGVPVDTIMIAGKADSRDLLGTARGWSTGGPCRAASLIHESHCANPIVILEELDKPGTSTVNGNPHQSLLPLLSPVTARRFYDEFLGGELDLSYVTWIGTANSVARIPAALLSRLRVFEVKGPRRSHYPAIVRQMIETYRKRYGIPYDVMPILEPEDWSVLKRYCRNLREMERAVEHWLGMQLLEIYRTQKRH